MRAGGYEKSELPSSELILFLFEEQVERRQRAVAAGDVLLHFHFLTVREGGVAVDFLFQHPQLVADAHNLVEEDLERDFLGLQRGVGRVEDGFSLVPAGCELVDDGIGLFDAQPLHHALDDGFDKLPERHFQVGSRDMGFRRCELAGIGVQRAHRIVKPDIGQVLGDALDDTHPVMGMFDSLAYGQVLNFHI